jgi:beta-glucanase (GH16 family)
VRPFADPALVDGFEKVALDIDVTQFHVYAAEWTPSHVDFLVDGRRVKTVAQSPAYPMQLMLNIYQFAGAERDARPPGSYPVEFAVDYFRAYQPLAGYPAR